jgi:murein DD-endopeptidase MepM/ murein hydrolase activator NlpD
MARPPRLTALAAALALAPAAPADAQQATGGARYGAEIAVAPVARTFALAPQAVRAPALPRLTLRIDQPGARAVRARVVFWPAGDGAVLARADLGRVAVGRTLRPALPEGLALRPGRYVVRVHVGGELRLARAAGASGRATLTVRAPVPPPTPAPAAAATAGRGVFPLRGPSSMPPGGSFGSDRGTHRHEGQDISAPEGTPVVAPVAGRVAHVAFQADGAGHYVVLDGVDGRAYFFAHLRAGTVVVAPGAAVAAGAPLAQVGSTGRSSGPHLHFEIWVGGWRRSPASRPVDPLPDLRAWAG